jgi:hypothetical protein
LEFENRGGPGARPAALEVSEVGDAGLERELEALVTA